MKKIFAFVSLLFVFSSCQLVFKIVAGVHDCNKPSHVGDLKKYAIKLGMHYDNIVYPLDSNAFQRTHMRLTRGFPAMDVFNHEGYRIIVNDIAICSNPLSDFTKIICDGKFAGIDSSRRLDEELADYIRIPMISSTQAVPKSSYEFMKMDTSADYTVIIYFMYCVRRMNKEYTAPWEKNLLDQKNCKVNVLKVSLDKTVEIVNY